jgi:hypothetical protein
LGASSLAMETTTGRTSRTISGVRNLGIRSSEVQGHQLEGVHGDD